MISVSNIADVHEFIRFILNKEMGGFFSPEDLDMLVHRAQMSRFNYRVEQYSKTQKLHDSISPFSVKFQFTTTGNGIIQLPVPTTPAPKPAIQYEHLLSLWVQYTDSNSIVRYKPIKIVNEDELAARLDSQILKPTLIDPVANEPSPGTIQLEPQAAMSGYGFYLKTPQPPKYDYDPEDVNFTYRPANSKQLEWNESSLEEIMFLAIQLAGVNLTDEQRVRYTMQKETAEV